MLTTRIYYNTMVKNKRDLKFSPHRNRPVRKSLSKTKNGESTTPSSTANIKVVVRVRPPNQKELDSNYRAIVKIVDSDMVIFDPKEEIEPFFFRGVKQKGRDMLKKENKNIEFQFDRVFGFDSNNDDVFENSTKNLINSLMDGYNCSVFVYGATGAGKTHTMLGHNGNPGITFLTMRELFTQIAEHETEREFELGITYLEVYNETVKDLLNPGGPLHLREDKKFGVCVSGIELHRIKSSEELFFLLEKGNSNRTQHPTDANAESSRSHAVFQVYVNMLTRNNGQRRVAKLSMIDLAGSERGAATGCSGMRFTEGANINKSLLALGNCINNLADGHRHIPYRDSKLTRLLKDSLGGNCQTVMIANISPSFPNFEDTYNTLKYATRAKKIKSNMKKNVINCELTIPQYIKLVEQLNKENEALKAQLKNVLVTPAAAGETPVVVAETTAVVAENLAVVAETPTVVVETPAVVAETPAVVAETGAIICTSCQGEKAKQIPPIEPHWRPTLQSLLKEQWNLSTEILKLTNAEEVLSHRILIKKQNEYIATGLSDEDEQHNGINRILTTVNKYQRERSSLKQKMDDLKKQLDAVETKLQCLMIKENIPNDDIFIIQNKIDLNADQHSIQIDHCDKKIELYKMELEEKDKILQNVCEKFHNYFLLLRGYGHVTEKMSHSYRKLVKNMQGVRNVTFQDLEIKDSGCSVGASNSSTTSNKSIIPDVSPLEVTPDKRPTVKRKLYDSTTCVKNHNNINAHEVQPSCLNETITLASTIDPRGLNSTFCLHDKEDVPKKKALTEQRNRTCANKMLPKAYVKPAKKTITVSKTKPRINNNRFNSNVVKTQRFPIQKNENPQSASKFQPVTTVRFKF